MIIGISEGAQDISFDRDGATLQEQVERDRAARSDVPSFASIVGAGIGGQTGQQRRMYIKLKPWAQRQGDGAAVYRPAAAEAADASRASSVFLQRRRTSGWAARLSRTQYQYTLQDADLGELYDWAPKVLAKLRSLPMLRDVATDQQIAGTTATLTIDRDAAARFGIQPQLIDDTLYDAFGQREITQYFTQLNSYYVILEVPPDLQGESGTLTSFTCKSANGQAVPLSTLVKMDTDPVAPLSINHQSQFPAVTISFNLAAGAALGDAVHGDRAAMARVGTRRRRCRAASRAPRRRSSRRCRASPI